VRWALGDAICVMTSMLHSVIAMLNNRTIAVTDDALLRPLTARSIVLSVLLGSHPPSMPVRRLLDFTSLFGIDDGTVRTALSRMVASGELLGDDGVYRLGDRLLTRQLEQDTGRLDPPGAWDGSWWVVVVTAERRSQAQRRDFRARATGARLGELRADTWLRPANVAIPLDLDGVLVTRGPLAIGDDIDVVRRLWDLEALDRHARTHHAALTRRITELARSGDDALRDAFVDLAAAQRYLRTEPQLPSPLAASTAPADLRRQYDLAVTAFQGRLRRFFDRVQ
jgi:phenylacetic acid degradation operon negative regulatory protein